MHDSLAHPRRLVHECAKRFRELLRTTTPLLLAAALGATALAGSSPLSPRDALAGFDVERDLRVELVAAEPDVVDPIAMAFDERGRLFVVEGRGYPTDLGRGVIALLESDGDGRYARRGAFARELDFPTGLMPWRGGLIVTDAPNVLWLEDRDGDGREDRRTILLRGFATDRSTQLRVNDPTLGPDGWIWFAGGLSHGAVGSLRGDGVVDLRRGDLRMEPHSLAIAPATGKSQYGIALDDFGRRFLCTNRVQARHVVIESSILARNPRLTFSRTVQDLPEERIDDLLRGHNAAARIFPISDNVTTADSHAGTFSAACAVTIWRGGALPSRLNGQILSCDPTGNLVHRDALVPRGATFAARRSADERELMRSTDNWFRPVFLADGPDGALYVCDMYRKVIEHPDYLPEEVRIRTDFRSGRDRGRIYRVTARTPETTSPATRGPEGREGEWLESPTAWRRETAYRLLVERVVDEPEGVERIARRVLASGASPESSAAALALLARAGTLESADVLGALRSRHAGLREVALRLGVPPVASSGALRAAVLELARDDDPRVRFCASIAIGDLHDDGDPDAIHAALAEIVRRAPGDEWTVAAVLSSAAGRELHLLRVLALPSPGEELAAALGEIARTAAAASEASARESLLREVLSESWSGAEIARLVIVNGFATRGGLPSSIHRELKALAAAAARDATDTTQSTATRVAAIELIGHAAAGEHGAVLVEILDPALPTELQLAAVRALARGRRDPSGAVFDESRWASSPIAVREALLRSFLRYESFATRLLDAVESGEIAPIEIGADARASLEKHSVVALRERARELLEAANSDRRAVYERLRSTAARKGDPTRGREIFREQCAPCHRLDREGFNVGPDLFGMRRQPKEAILLHLLVPNQEIAPGFEAWTIVTKSGESLTGIVTSESPAGVTVRLKGGEERAVPRSEIRAKSASGTSLMPDGLEAATDEQGITDLLAYLRGEG